MKKRILAVLTALTVMAMGSMSVMAASPTVGTTEAPVAGQTAVTAVTETFAPSDYVAATSTSAGFAAAPVSASTVQAATVAVQNLLLNDLASLGNGLGNASIAAAAGNSSAKVTANILSVVDVNATTATKVNGVYNVTLSMSSIAAGDAIVVLHYNGSAWEAIVPSSVANGSVTFQTASLSPIAVVKVNAAAAATSPKTGSSMPIAAAAVVVGLAGVVVCGKKYFA